MAEVALYSTFISYAHEEIDFVDLLNAGLKSRGVNTWCDRKNLHPAQLWQSEINKALANSRSMVLVLSRASYTSTQVQREYTVAHHLNNQRRHQENIQIIPVKYEECPWQPIEHWIDITGVGANEQDGNEKRAMQVSDALNKILFALWSPLLSNSNPRELYQFAVQRLTSHTVADREAAAAILQYIIDENLRSGDPLVAMATIDLQKLNEDLYPYRLKYLFEVAMAAHRNGDYSAEVGALKSRLALGHQDEPTYRWAKTYLAIAERNAQYTDSYEVAREEVARGNYQGARDKLKLIWENAPYYRDPVGLAPVVGLHVPKSYEETEELKSTDQVQMARLDVVRRY